MGAAAPVLWLFLLSPSAPGPLWAYRVKELDAASTLGIEANFRAGAGDNFTLRKEARPFVTGLEAAPIEGSFAPVSPSESGWSIPCAEGCRLRYRFPLSLATRALKGTAGSAAFDDGLVTSTSLWLIRPDDEPEGGRYRVRVETFGDHRFVSGVEKVDASTHEGPIEWVAPAPFAAFGRLTIRHLDIGGARIDLAYPPGRFEAGDAAIEAWATGLIEAIAGYFRRFPVPYALVLLVPMRGHELGRSTAMGFGGASVRVQVGQSMTKAELHRSWELTHELCHLALPNLGGDHQWIEEGLATYLEPIVRIRAGLESREKLWSGFAWGFPHGLPTWGSDGFDGTRSWGETYWGGALYFFLADLEIRTRSDNQKSLDDALRAMVDAGQNLTVASEVEPLLSIGDRATGTTVLADLYRRVARAPNKVDLTAIWKSLGVTFEGDEVRFDDDAPLAKVRRGIEAGR